MCIACYLRGAAADAHNPQAAASLLYFDGYRAANFFLALGRVHNDFFALSGARALGVRPPPSSHGPPPPLPLRLQFRCRLSAH